MKYTVLDNCLKLAALPLVVKAARNPKKGVALAGAQACSSLEPHTDSSWWYSWGTVPGFDSKYSFCDTSTQSPNPTDAARTAGMEFVPMFWNSVPGPANLSADEVASMQAASHVMGFNEPERQDQANLTPAQAAAMWSDVVTIANDYNLKVVGPCMTKDAFDWFDQWLNECNILYPGVGCHHDAVCIHIYQQPHPCDTSKNWECIGDETGYHAKNYLNRWWDDYGNKPIWVTEYGCYPWVTGGCDASKHEALMNQLTSIFESPEFTNKVERYNWFTTYASDPLGFGSGALNVPNWDHLGDGVGCPNAEWIANAKPGFSWGIDHMHQCVDLAKTNANCHSPLVVSLDNDNCYCSRDECATVQSTWGGMKTFRELDLQPVDASSLSLSGERYNSFGAVTGTPAPTDQPTSNPTSVPTSQPTKAPVPAPIASIVKFMCSNKDKTDLTICMEGAPALGSNCIAEGASCGGGNKVCQLAECPGDNNGPPSPPSPTPEPPSPPTTGCFSSGATCGNDSDCCSGSCTKYRGSKTCG